MAADESGHVRVVWDKANGRVRAVVIPNVSLAMDVNRSGPGGELIRRRYKYHDNRHEAGEAPRWRYRSVTRPGEFHSARPDIAVEIVVPIYDLMDRDEGFEQAHVLGVVNLEWVQPLDDARIAQLIEHLDQFLYKDRRLPISAFSSEIVHCVSWDADLELDGGG